MGRRGQPPGGPCPGTPPRDGSGSKPGPGPRGREKVQERGAPGGLRRLLPPGGPRPGPPRAIPSPPSPPRGARVPSSQRERMLGSMPCHHLLRPGTDRPAPLESRPGAGGAPRATLGRPPGPLAPAGGPRGTGPQARRGMLQFHASLSLSLSGCGLGQWTRVSSCVVHGGASILPPPPRRPEDRGQKGRMRGGGPRAAGALRAGRPGRREPGPAGRRTPPPPLPGSSRLAEPNLQRTQLRSRGPPGPRC